jgi:hypothetical protein
MLSCFASLSLHRPDQMKRNQIRPSGINLDSPILAQCAPHIWIQGLYQ